MLGAKYVAKRFVFDNQSILKLKAIARSGGFNSKREPSRVELVTALVSIALLKIAKLRNGQSKPFLISHTLNLRGRTDLLWHDNLGGNVYTMVNGKSTAEVTELGLHGLVGLVRDAITTLLAKLPNAIDGEDLGDMVTNSVGQFQEELRKGDTDVLIFTSWCRFPLYQVNLGWGEPEFVSSLCTSFDSVMLMDHKKGGDYNGVEAWVSLTEEDMDLFRQQDDILEYASHK
ncbi:acetyl-CoA-benzylalcohol acetyltransferase-like [Eucalyptus grandis]|uniref:acetyl-CoA-benzylalcohol acetyltransferase-like n=1 Tax=Eucalyptus grandis TaxID=71139 RepID=UPI00192EC896|nr:acetyl-CoA-benzylalcohol acetyltransferase-like [Eucalyptus grandis]